MKNKCLIVGCHCSLCHERSVTKDPCLSRGVEAFSSHDALRKADRFVDTTTFNGPQNFYPPTVAFEIGFSPFFFFFFEILTLFSCLCQRYAENSIYNSKLMNPLILPH